MVVFGGCDDDRDRVDEQEECDKKHSQGVSVAGFNMRASYWNFKSCWHLNVVCVSLPCLQKLMSLISSTKLWKVCAF